MAPDIPQLMMNNGLTIPQLGLGVWQATDNEAESAVSSALAAGYRLIDTAAIYRNEQGVGRAIASSGIARSELFITTKLWNADQGYDEALVAYETSLERLGLDYVDLYLIHWPMPEVGKYIESWRALEDLYANGKVKAIGVSNFMPEHLEKLMKETDVVPAINQIELHPDFQQTETRSLCTENGILVESWSPLGGPHGSLLDDDTLKDIAVVYSKTPAQVAIRWHIQNGLIVIPKSVHVERIHENSNVFDFELTDDDMEAISKLDGDNRQGPNPAIMNNA